MPELALAIRYEAADGGLVPIVFTPGARALIEPSSTLVVGANLGLRNHRVRVFDEADRAMASDDEAAPGPALDYRIRFPTPLKSGHKYTLVLDAQTGPTFADESGRAQPDQRLEFQVAGEREKPTPPPKKKSPPGKRRRR